MLPIRIVGTGKYLPQNSVSCDQLDDQLGFAKGTTLGISGVATRHIVGDETASFMGAAAARTALETAQLTLNDIDCIVCGSGTHEQALPSTAALIAKQLGAQARGIPAFDVNATCLSFVTAMDLLAYPTAQKRYRHVLIISTDISTVGLDWTDKESCTLFGDGAAAVIIRASEHHESSKIMAASMKTYSEGAHFTEVRGGGTRFHPRHYCEPDGSPHLFQMDGRQVFKLSMQILPSFVESLLKSVALTMEDLNLVIPHQASVSALRLISKRLKFPVSKTLVTVHKYGNTVAASIPIALHDAITEGLIVRGDKVLLIGTAAGLSVGAMILDY